MTIRDTSREAFKSITDVQKEEVRTRIFNLIEKRGETGLTCDEAEQIFGLLHQSASARICELLETKRIKYEGMRRKTRSGRSARVYTVA